VALQLKSFHLPQAEMSAVVRRHSHRIYSVYLMTLYQLLNFYNVECYGGGGMIIIVVGSGGKYSMSQNNVTTTFVL
jgi:hypothetical protein